MILTSISGRVFLPPHRGQTSDFGSWMFASGPRSNVALGFPCFASPPRHASFLTRGQSRLNTGDSGMGRAHDGSGRRVRGSEWRSNLVHPKLESVARGKFAPADAVGRVSELPAELHPFPPAGTIYRKEERMRALAWILILSVAASSDPPNITFAPNGLAYRKPSSWRKSHSGHCLSDRWSAKIGFSITREVDSEPGVVVGSVVSFTVANAAEIDPRLKFDGYTMPGRRFDYSDFCRRLAEHLTDRSGQTVDAAAVFHATRVKRLGNTTEFNGCLSLQWVATGYDETVVFRVILWNGSFYAVVGFGDSNLEAILQEVREIVASVGLIA